MESASLFSYPNQLSDSPLYAHNGTSLLTINVHKFLITVTDDKRVHYRLKASALGEQLVGYFSQIKRHFKTTQEKTRVLAPRFSSDTTYIS